MTDPQDSRLAVGPNQRRLRELQRTRRRLLREIDKKRVALTQTQALAFDAKSALRSGLTPLLEEKDELERALPLALAQVLDPQGGLSRFERAQARRLYSALIPEFPQSEPLPSNNSRSSRPLPHTKPRPTERPLPASPSASTRAPDPTVHAVFRRLARSLHPDVEQDLEQRDELTRVMMEVTAAYHDRDLARLIELESQWLAQASVPLVAATHLVESEQLKTELRGLRHQLRALTAELKSERVVAPGLHRGLDELSRDVQQLRTLLQYLERYLQGTLSTQELLLGPD